MEIREKPRIEIEDIITKELIILDAEEKAMKLMESGRTEEGLALYTKSLELRVKLADMDSLV